MAIFRFPSPLDRWQRSSAPIKWFEGVLLFSGIGYQKYLLQGWKGDTEAWFLLAPLGYPLILSLLFVLNLLGHLIAGMFAIFASIFGVHAERQAGPMSALIGLVRTLVIAMIDFHESILRILWVVPPEQKAALPPVSNSTVNQVINNTINTTYHGYVNKGNMTINSPTTHYHVPVAIVSPPGQAPATSPSGLGRSVATVSVPLAATTNAAQIRQLLDTKLSIDSEIDRFCIDYYPLVAKQFSAGMSRDQKLNLLLQRADLSDLEYRLRTVL